MQRFSLPIGLVHGLERGNRLVKHVAGGILERLARIRGGLNVGLLAQQAADHAGHLAKQAHTRLHQRRRSSENRALTISQGIPAVGGHHTVAVQIRHGTVEEVLRLKHADMLRVNRNRLIQVEVGGVRLDVSHIELLDHLVHREHVTVGRD